MPHLTLTTAERIIIANQFKILAKLDETNAEDHIQSADIVRHGYAGLYDNVFGDVSDEEEPRSVTTDVHLILSMFHTLQNHIGTLNDEERARLDMDTLSFDGFDNNRDPHYLQADFMVNRMGMYEELNGHSMESHSSASLPRYRRMLDVFNEVVEDNRNFSVENLLRIQEA